MAKNTGKVREFCQPGKVGTLICDVEIGNTGYEKKVILKGQFCRTA